MKKKILSYLALLLCCSVITTTVGCSFGRSDVVLRERQARELVSQPVPDNQTREEQLPKAPKRAVKQDGESFVMQTAEFTLQFVNSNHTYSLRVSDGETAYISANPVGLTVYSASEPFDWECPYTAVAITDYGCLATAKVPTGNGGVFVVEDRYYFPKELPEKAVNVRRTMTTDGQAGAGVGYSTFYQFNSDSAENDLRYFVPHTVYNSFAVVGRSGTFAETELGLPMAAMMNGGGFSLSLSRYQPTIHPAGNYTASLEVSAQVGRVKRPGVRVDYPSKALSQPYFEAATQPQVVFDLSITAGQNTDYNDMMVRTYNDHYTLQNPRVVDTDIDRVLEVICDDYKTFMLTTDMGDGNVSYGLPWRVTIENGWIGPKSYQSGFVGQQVPAAYQMLFYGIRYDDNASVQNGLNILNFWVDAGMMNPSGVPKIWYNGDTNTFNAYPTFLRMAIDTMEGYLDAYILANENGIACDSWKNALVLFADFLVRAQNDDGSFYRCYNQDGGMYAAGDNGIPEPDGNICQSSSKENTAMAVRFLAEMYGLTDDERYKSAAIAAGEYVYANQYKRGYYVGGTCDNANVVDKEAGVFALYAYDTMYSLTRDEKWVDPMKQATAFVMSMVQCFGFPAGTDSNLKAAVGTKAGYVDGSSFITAEMNGVDNFAAVIYYHLFRLYVITGEPVYFYQAEFMQQNTKSLMDWDGKLGYPYKSLLPEATTVFDFGFSSATDPNGTMGVWLPWQSVANASPICEMIKQFGTADVADLADTPTKTLYKQLFS